MQQKVAWLAQHYPMSAGLLFELSTGFRSGFFGLFSVSCLKESTLIADIHKDSTGNIQVAPGLQRSVLRRFTITTVLKPESQKYI
jgi:hypothetical protein